VDLAAAIQSLRAELMRVDQTIAALEGLRQVEGASAAEVKTPVKRGRKVMNPEERREVGERMRRYWAQRRQEKLG
jgi:hypothetical protein